MKTIWKFPIATTFRQDVEMPRGSQIKSAQHQHGQLCIWAEVNPKADKCKRQIVIIGTGHELPREGYGMEFVATVLELDGLLVWHIYEDTIQP